MNIIKKFELFDFNQTLPYTTNSELTSYYHCDNCDCSWKELNKICNKCKKCNSIEIEELSKDEWEKINDLKSDDDNIIDLYSLGSKKYKKNVN